MDRIAAARGAIVRLRFVVRVLATAISEIVVIIIIIIIIIIVIIIIIIIIVVVVNVIVIVIVIVIQSVAQKENDLFCTKTNV